MTASSPTERDLASSRHRLLATQARCSDAAVLIDRDLSVIDAALHDRSLLGLDPETWRNVVPLQLVHPGDRDVAVGVLGALLRPVGGADVRAALRLLRADGQYIEVEVSGSNLLDDPDVRAIVLVLRAIDGRTAAPPTHEARQSAAPPD